jgi:hypothetical protein
MNLLDFFQQMVSRGVVLTARGGKLMVDAPAGVLTEQDRAFLTRYKADLLALLAGPSSPAELAPEWHLLWDERAAILEYDGGLPRERAEALALAELVHHLDVGAG